MVLPVSYLARRLNLSEKKKKTKRIRVRSKTRRVVNKSKAPKIKPKTERAVKVEPKAADAVATPRGSAKVAASTPRGSVKTAEVATPRGKQPKGHTQGYRAPTKWNKKSQVLNLRLKTDLFRWVVDSANKADTFPGTFAAGIIAEYRDRTVNASAPARAKLAQVGRALKRVLKGDSRKAPKGKPPRIRVRPRKTGRVTK